MSSTPATIHVRDHSKAKQAHKLVLYELAGHADDDGWAWPGVITLMEKTGYKRKWVEKVLEDLVRTGEITREKVGRSYRYHLYVYNRQTKTCTCALTDHMAEEAEAHGHLVPEHGQLIPEHGQLIPGYGHTSDANPSSGNGNPAEPCLNQIEPGLNREPRSLSPRAKETRAFWCDTCHTQHASLACPT